MTASDHSLPEQMPVTGSAHVELRRRTPPITCTSCRITYLAPDPSPPAGSPDGWLCTLCREQTGVGD